MSISLPATVLTYLHHPWAIQFICLDWEFLNYLVLHPIELQRVSLLSVASYCLKNFQTLDRAGLKLPFSHSAKTVELATTSSIQRLDNSTFILHHLPSMQLAVTLANLSDCMVVEHASDEYLNYSLTETWSELEELMDGEVRKLQGIMVYPESGLEIEILKAENNRYYVREMTTALFLHKRSTGVTRNTVINWVKQAFQKIPEENYEIPQTAQLDELQTFVGSKKTKFGFGQ